MLDKYIVPIIKPPLSRVASVLQQKGVGADTVTVVGFVIGLLCVLALSLDAPLFALLFLLLNRLADGIDGELARKQSPTDAGGFLDISLDFIFYAVFPLGFAMSNPLENALPAAVLIASFVGTGASFLAFASLANKHRIEHPEFNYKGLYYLNGLAEGTETVLFFCVMCLLPNYFPLLAWLFAAICAVTAVNRVWFGYLTLSRASNDN